MFLSLTLICRSDSIYQEYNMNQILESRGVLIYPIVIPLVCYICIPPNSGISVFICYVHMMKIIKIYIYKKTHWKQWESTDKCSFFFTFKVPAPQGLVTIFIFFPSTLKTTREESKMSNFHTTLFQNSFVLVSWPHSP